MLDSITSLKLLSVKTKNLLLFLAFLCFISGMALVYLTPLKYSQLIEPKLQDVDAKDIHTMMQAHPEQYDFIDVRGIADYSNAHAAGSRNVPLHKMFFERLTLPKHGKTIVLICSGGTASAVAYMYLEHFGFRNLLHVEGGIEKWQAYELPTQSGS